jgi:hypothetical protein
MFCQPKVEIASLTAVISSRRRALKNVNPEIQQPPPQKRPIPFKAMGLLSISGSPGRIRTADQVVNSHPLYRLSYRGMLSFY